MATVFQLAGGELAGAVIAVDEERKGHPHPLIRVPDGSNDERRDYLLQVSADQERIKVLWPAARGPLNKRRTAVYHRNGEQFIFTGEGRDARQTDQ